MRKMVCGVWFFCGVMWRCVSHPVLFCSRSHVLRFCFTASACREFGAADGAAHAPKDTVQAQPPGSQWLLVLPPQQSAARSFSVRAPTGYGCES